MVTWIGTIAQHKKNRAKRRRLSSPFLLLVYNRLLSIPMAQAIVQSISEMDLNTASYMKKFQKRKIDYVFLKAEKKT